MKPSKAPARGALRVLDSREASFERRFGALLERRDADTEAVQRAVERILERVRTRGDKGLYDCVRRFDAAVPERLEVDAEEWERGCDAVDPADRASLAKAAGRIREFHAKRIPSSWEIRDATSSVGQRVRPLERVGCYVPGGKALYPSSVLMNALPAQVAGVREIVMVSPPRADGSLAPEVLLAARLAGVTRIFKMGGAHAIAALAHGTESVPRVDKIVGPGNLYVATAKRLVFGQVAIDAEAGPSEVLVIADDSATPAWVASDLISQAEHDERAAALLLSPSAALISRVQTELKRQLAELPRAGIVRKALARRGVAIRTRDLAECVALSNRHAPEHLVLAVDAAEELSRGVLHAGAIFLGHTTPVAVGDYLAGPNHVLPTAGTARFFSPLGVEDFLKRSSLVRFDAAKLAELGPDVIRLARLEGLGGHARSVELRLGPSRRASRPRPPERGR